MTHGAASSVPQIEVGGTIPSDVPVKEKDFMKGAPLVLTGKNILVGVPGAFTTPCNAHLPGYVSKFEEFKAKGIDGIYIFGVNDVFVMQAWSASLAPSGTPIHFIADDAGTFVSALGLAFDGTHLLGGTRSKRFALVAEGDKVLSLVVEDKPTSVNVTSADAVLAAL